MSTELTRIEYDQIVELLSNLLGQHPSSGGTVRLSLKSERTGQLDGARGGWGSDCTQSIKLIHWTRNSSLTNRVAAALFCRQRL